MTGGMKRLRGQPLAVLLALLAGWLGARATTWQWPGTLAEQVLSDTALAVEPGGAPIRAVVADHAATAAFSLPGAGFAPEYQPDPGLRPMPSGSYRQGRGDMPLSAETLLARLIAALMREREAMAGYPVPVSAEHAAPVDVAASFPPLSAPPPAGRERMPAGRRGGGWLGGSGPGAGWPGSDWARSDFPGEGWSGRGSAGAGDGDIEAGASDRQVALAAPAGPERRRWSADAWGFCAAAPARLRPGSLQPAMAEASPAQSYAIVSRWRIAGGRRSICAPPPRSTALLRATLVSGFRHDRSRRSRSKPGWKGG